MISKIKFPYLKQILVWLALFVAISLLYFKDTSIYGLLNSDLLFFDFFSRDFFLHPSFFSEWRFPPGPAYFPEVFLYLIGYKVFPTVVSRVFFVTAFQALSLTLVCLWLGKKVRPELSLNAQALIVLSVTYIVLVAAYSNMWLFIYTTNSHFSALLFSLLLTGLILSFFERPRMVVSVSIVLIGAIAKISTIVFLVYFVVPALITISWLFLFSKKINISIEGFREKLRFIFLLLLISQMLAMIVNHLIAFHFALEGRLSFFGHPAKQSLLMFFKIVRAGITPHYFREILLFPMFFVLAALFFLGYQFVWSFKCKADAIRKIPQRIFLNIFEGLNGKNWRFAFCALLLAVALPVNIVSVIASGGLGDMDGYRYFSFPIALVWLLTIVLLDVQKPRCLLMKDFVIYFLGLLMLFSSIKNLHYTIKHYQPFQNPIANCLIALEAKGFFLSAGVADYWRARGVSHFLPKKNLILAVFNDLSPFFWMSSLAPIKYQKDYYNFVILSTAGARDPFDFNYSTLKKKLPEPTLIYKCKAGKAEILWYKNDELDILVKRQEQKFLSDLYEGEKNLRKNRTFMKQLISP